LEKYNILILSAVGGHDTAAKAIKEQFDKYYDDCEAVIVPMDEYAGKAFMKLNDGFWTFCCRYCRFLFWPYQKFMNFRNRLKLKRLKKRYLKNGRDGNSVREENFFFPIRRIYDLYVKYYTKVIVATQCAAAALAVAAKKKYGLSVKVISAQPDYVVDLIAVRYGADGFVVENEESRQFLRQYGIEDEKIRIIGIPAFEKFNTENDKAAMREYFGLPDKKTVMLAGGTFGSGKTKKIYRSLLRNFPEANILAVAGRSETLRVYFERLKTKYAAENVHVFGYTMEFDKLLDAADLIISKPGALSSNEAFLKGVPVVSVFPMPHVESGNYEYFRQHRLALCANSYADVSTMVKALLTNPEIGEELAVNMKGHINRSAAKEEAAYIYSMIEK
jgi:processive 1,2-diacylglycerol beta-glucosyltransferase